MHRIVHFEMHSSEPEKTNAFFADVFGWNINKWDGPMEYWLDSTGDPDSKSIDGGLMRSQDGQPRTVNTIEVPSIEDFSKKITDAGGTVVVEKFAIPGVGWIAYATEPAGNIFGIYRHDESAK